MCMRPCNGPSLHAICAVHRAGWPLAAQHGYISCTTSNPASARGRSARAGTRTPTGWVRRGCAALPVHVPVVGRSKAVVCLGSPGSLPCLGAPPPLLRAPAPSPTPHCPAAPRSLFGLASVQTPGESSPCGVGPVVPTRLGSGVGRVGCGSVPPLECPWSHEGVDTRRYGRSRNEELNLSRS